MRGTNWTRDDDDYGDTKPSLARKESERNERLARKEGIRKQSEQDSSDACVDKKFRWLLLPEDV